MSFFSRGTPAATPVAPSAPPTPLKSGGQPGAPLPTSTASATRGNGTFRVNKSPTEALALTNCIIGSPKDFDASVKYILVDDLYAFTLRWAGGLETVWKEGRVSWNGTPGNETQNWTRCNLFNLGSNRHSQLENLELPSFTVDSPRCL